MAELGESSAKAHQQVGTLAYQIGIDHLVCVDAPDYQPVEQSEGQTNLHLCDRSGARVIAEQIEPGDVILVKASRSEKFEILAEDIEEVVKRKITADLAGGEEE
jgi:UDP-N-acetylmuramoyl-tripeptide--D-alanyl-D-alanine ligase